MTNARYIRTKLGMLAMAAMALLLTHAVRGATVTVSNLGDSGSGTLRSALTAAADGDTINFSVTGTITLTTGELSVVKNLAILGPGPGNLIVDGNASSRVFYISPNQTVTLAGLTVSNGFVGGGPLPNAVIDSGAGIYNDHATLTVSNSVLTGNNATNWSGSGAGIYSDGANGGTASVQIINSTLSRNYAAFYGGGIDNEGYSGGSARLQLINTILDSNSGGGGILNNGSGGSAWAAIHNCILSRNSATAIDAGGAISNEGGNGEGRVEITESVLSGNSGGEGGAIYNQDAVLVVSNSSFIGNMGYDGGAIFNLAESSGGAKAELVNSTLSHNSAPGGGGGVFNLGGGTVEIRNSTLSGNTSGYYGAAIENDAFGGAVAFVRILNSTLSSNSAPSGIVIDNESQGEPGDQALVEIGGTILSTDAAEGSIQSRFVGSAVTSLGYNLSSDDGGGFLNQPTDLINTDPKIGPLRDNGGPTLTHALLCGSPAIDTGRNFSGFPNDQRGVGFARTVDDPFVANASGGDGTDIGSFEVQRSCNQPPVAKCKSVIVSTGPSCTASASIDDGSFDPDADAITITQSPPGPYPLGTNVVTLIVTDSYGASSICSSTVSVVDRTPPAISNESVSRSTLWPPNHKMIDVFVDYDLSDNCDVPTASLALSSDEPAGGGGAGRTSPDWEVVGAHHVRLRAERSEPGHGRTYTIRIICADEAGNSSSKILTVHVPKG